MTKSKINIFILYITAFGFLWIGYALLIVPIYGYSGFKWSPSIIKAFESLLAILFFVWLLPSTIKKPSDLFVHIHFLFPFLPMLVIYGASDQSRMYMYFAIFAFFVASWVRKFKIPKIKGDFIAIKIMIWCSLVIVSVYIFSIFMQGGLKFFNLDLLKVYEYRSDAAENMHGIVRYFRPWISNVLLPFLLLLAVYRRKWLIATIAMCGSVMIMSLTGHKGPLFYPFFALAIYYVMRSNRRIIIFLLTGYILIILVSLIPILTSKNGPVEFNLFNIVMNSMLFRRGYFVPAQLNFAYYDLFSTIPHIIWAESKLSFGLVEYPYDLSSAHMVGYYIFDKPQTGANTGWLGSGYMQLGFAGMMFYALLVGLLLSVADTLAKNRNIGIVCAIILIPYLSFFISSDLPTVLLTHGLLFALLLVWSCRLSPK